MLSIGKMVARSGEYYIATVANGREEYYTGSGESPGFWLGEGARRLGLEGAVDPDDLRHVFAGISPGGEILTAGRVDEAKRVAGFDLTWSAPKSVSLLFGLSDPATSAMVRGVHEDAVDQALGYLERHALRVRRGAGGENAIGAEGLVAAAFTHRTSRAGDACGQHVGAKVVLVRRSPPATRDRSWRRLGRLDRSARGDRAQREPAPAGVVGARHPLWRHRQQRGRESDL